jgi:hypothetical protein
MSDLQKYGAVLAGMCVGILALGTLASAGTNRLSLDPYSASLAGGATVIQSGFDAPLRLPANSGTPRFALGFTIPQDYAPDTPLRIVILWETPATQCTFFLRANLLFRARAGQPRDFGNATGGLEPLSASTAFTLIAASGIVMAAPATAHETARVTFTITPTPGEFPTLRRGDAVNFGIFREDRDAANDTCTGELGELGIAGLSIVYTTP